jgi:hypothetical protein
MTMQTGPVPTTSVTRQITVEVPIERAFDVFTSGIGTWWPPSHLQLGYLARLAG